MRGESGKSFPRRHWSRDPKDEKELPSQCKPPGEGTSGPGGSKCERVQRRVRRWECRAISWEAPQVGQELCSPTVRQGAHLLSLTSRGRAHPAATDYKRPRGAMARRGFRAQDCEVWCYWGSGVLLYTIGLSVTRFSGRSKIWLGMQRPSRGSGREGGREASSPAICSSVSWSAWKSRREKVSHRLVYIFLAQPGPLW